MLLNVDLTPEETEDLKKEAERKGVAPEALAGMAITIHVLSNKRTRQVAKAATARQRIGRLATAEEIAARVAALNSMGTYETRASVGLMPLTDEDISRESIYGGRGL